MRGTSDPGPDRDARVSDGPPLEPGLYVVSTPIGNLEDVTLRALRILRSVDLILAEDTRVTRRLLSAYDIRTRLSRYDDHAPEGREAALAAEILAGARIALVSDAGTPLVSDPGYRLVSGVIAAGARVWPIPGPSAVLAALAASGLPTDRFLFAGFPPARRSGRRAGFEELSAVRSTLVFYETGPRLRESLADMAAVFGAERPAVVARELTKMFETLYRGSLGALAADPALEAPKGEIVVAVGPGAAPAATEDELEAALEEALSRLAPGPAAAEVARRYSVAKRDLYRRALARRAGSDGE